MNRWLLLFLIVLGYIFGAWEFAYGQTWQSVRSPNDAGVYLWGNWQSCRQADGTYPERVYDHWIDGKCDWSLHMGPYREFALFRTNEQPDPDDHQTPANLLGPRYMVDDYSLRGKRNWTIPNLHLHISIAFAGGSRDECESYMVRVERKP